MLSEFRRAIVDKSTKRDDDDLKRKSLGRRTQLSCKKKRRRLLGIPDSLDSTNRYD